MLKDKFLKYLEVEKRYSIHTIRSYQNDINGFYEFCGITTDDIIGEIDHKLIRGWIVFLMNEGISPKSVIRKVSTLKSFYKYLLRNELVSKNPMEKVVIPKVEKKLPFFVEQNQMRALFDNVDFDDDFKGWRDKIVLSVLYSTGIRLNELINIKINDIDFSGKTVKVTGKRNKERILPVFPGLLEEIEEYLVVRDKEGINNEFLIVTNKGQKAYPKLIYRIVNHGIQQVSTIEKKSPHVIRHTFATHMLNNGSDLNAIKELLGHANLSATEIYTHNTFEKLKKTYNQAHPRA